MTRFLDVGICQMEVVDNKGVNLATATRMIREAAAAGCQLAVLPEMFNCPYAGHYFPVYAEPIPGITSTRLSELAREIGIYLIAGSIPERDGEQIFNTSMVFNPQGKMIAKHRKLHLFDVDIPGGITFFESDTLSPGKDVTTFTTSYGKMGLAICYDLRFPELARTMTMQGAEVIIYPGAFNQVTGPLHWEILLRARAVDNQVFILAASPANTPGGVYPAYGHSMVVDPWGKVIAEAGNEEALLTARIDLETVYQVRNEIPVLKHRRPEIYTY
ncbi:MAG: carbon-nitrogen hydrolase family protein [Syntrophomonadaceae bacterium]|nr:carbon-nitrogen hydrolase family protein [Syntrophomonadaceae bacterium]